MSEDVVPTQRSSKVREREKEVKFIVKEVRRHSAACITCQKRKQKCDGVAPCKFCTAKGIVCEFPEQKKRGPKKPRTATDASQDLSLSVASSTKEFSMLHQLEVEDLISYFMKFVNCVHIQHCYEEKKLLSPKNNCHKIQSYSVIAMCSRFRGDYVSASAYFSQARMLAGTIFDLADVEAVHAFNLMSNYCHVALDVALSAHYIHLAWDILRLVPKSKCERRLRYQCYTTSIMADSNMNGEEKSAALMREFTKFKNDEEFNPEDVGDQIFLAYLGLSARSLRVLGGDFYFPKSLPEVLHRLATVNISAEDRDTILADIKNIEAGCQLAGIDSSVIVDETENVTYMILVIYYAIIEWRGGRSKEAMRHAVGVLQLCEALDRNGTLSLICDAPHMLLIGGVVLYFCDEGLFDYANSLYIFLKKMCQLMGPSYRPIPQYVDEYRRRLQSANNANAPLLAAPLSFPSSPLSSPSSSLSDSLSSDSSFTPPLSFMSSSSSPSSVAPTPTPFSSLVFDPPANTTTVTTTTYTTTDAMPQSGTHTATTPDSLFYTPDLAKEDNSLHEFLDTWLTNDESGGFTEQLQFSSELSKI